MIVKASLEHDERMTEKKLKSRKFDGNGGTNRATCHITEIIQYVRISSDSSHGVLSSSIRSVDLFCLQSHIHVLTITIALSDHSDAPFETVNATILSLNVLQPPIKSSASADRSIVWYK